MDGMEGIVGKRKGWDGKGRNRMELKGIKWVEIKPDGLN